MSWFCGITTVNGCGFDSQWGSEFISFSRCCFLITTQSVNVSKTVLKVGNGESQHYISSPYLAHAGYSVKLKKKEKNIKQNIFLDLQFFLYIINYSSKFTQTLVKNQSTNLWGGRFI